MQLKFLSELIIHWSARVMVLINAILISTIEYLQHGVGFPGIYRAWAQKYPENMFEITISKIIVPGFVLSAFIMSALTYLVMEYERRKLPRMPRNICQEDASFSSFEIT